MNEAQTRLEKIDPKLKNTGWNIVENSRILVEVPITPGRIGPTRRGMKADYILSYKGVKLAVIEAKSDELPVGEGVAQAKEYADKLKIRFTYASNGNEIYAIDMQTGEEGLVASFPTPDELWKKTFHLNNEWRDRFNAQPFYVAEGKPRARYYQEIAINRALETIADGKKRLLLTLATGTGKTFIAFQIAWKLFQTKWNVENPGGRRPRILFLADRNILANQAFNGFFGFKQDARVRIRPETVRRDGQVPTNGSVFFTIFQTFMSGVNDEYNFGQYSKNFFDLIIIDECHRGGANDESNWRKIMDYFTDAVQIGMTATPRCDANADTYGYFGEPVYRYSLKEGINDGFLTPFRHCKMQSNIDEYVYDPEDEVISGEVEEGRVYTEQDFYKGNITIKERDRARVREVLRYIGENEKTLVFCATQNHAAAIRDMINQEHHGNTMYCVRVTANDGEIGDQYLSEFQDNEKTIPTVLTTSQKLSTGVDALNVRNIVLFRPINSMIEFKQIIGRGTRLYDGKNYFTIYDFVRAYEKFNDPEWDGDPVCAVCGNNPYTCEKPNPEPEPVIDDPFPLPNPEPGDPPEPVDEENSKLEIRLSENHVRKIKHIHTVMFLNANGIPISSEEFLRTMFGRMPEFFNTVDDLREKWSAPDTRKELLQKMDDAGYGKDVLKNVRAVIEADNSDLLDVLEYIAYNIPPIDKDERVEKIGFYKNGLPLVEKEFVDYMIEIYLKSDIDDLETRKLPEILELKYGSIHEGVEKLGGNESVRNIFFEFQKKLFMIPKGA